MTTLSSAKFPRGSEWRKWDLQVHTPDSVLNNQFGGDFNEYARRFFTAAINARVSVIGVTDYFCIEGYKKLRAIQMDEAQLTELVGGGLVPDVQQLLLLPNVELRTDPVVVRDGQASRINFHVIFSNEIDPEDIEQNFLHQLKIQAKATPDGDDDIWPLTLSNLKKLGVMLKEQHADFNGDSDLFVGMKTAIVPAQQISDALKKPGIFSDQYISLVACDEDLSAIRWDSQGHLSRKVLLQRCHAFFSSNGKSRQFALGQLHNSLEEFCREFVKPKPCFASSDAHAYEDLFKPANDRFTWIKADPTFRGLRQVLVEPAERVFIGRKPPILGEQSARATKILSRLEVRKSSEETIEGQWFSADIPLNSGLIAIIGNKGSGKSALADIVGLAGHSTNWESFSFLSSKRFKNTKQGLAKHFTATAHWMDGTVRQRSLNDTADATAIETIKYLPQSFLEDVCNEIDAHRGGRFQQELRSVIFSHVSDAERLGKAGLDELIDYKTKEIHDSITAQREQLSALNTQIASLEELVSAEHKQKLQAQLAEKEREIADHEQKRPVIQPSQAPEEGDEKRTQEAQALQALKDSLKLTEIKIQEANTALAKATQDKAKAGKIIASVKNLSNTVNEAIAKLKLELAEFGIDPASIVRWDVTTAPIEAVASNADAQIATVNQTLDPTNLKSLPNQKKQQEEHIVQATEKLDAPRKQLEQRKTEEAEWQKRLAALKGDASVLGSLEHIKATIQKSDDAPNQIAQLKEQRLAIVRLIYQGISSILDEYRRLYGPVKDYLSNTSLIDAGIRAGFRADLACRRFDDAFFALVNQGAKGSFKGSEEGKRKLRQLVEDADFASEDGCLAFVDTVIGLMEVDETGDVRRLSDQLKKGKTPLEFYNLLYSLDYLDHEFSLQWDGKDLRQLSPGERGSVLLVFYLLLDKEIIPLVIDQPEENLDNNTVYKTLVPCIRQAKERRQIILVTHNPNLAVVCDADQVIIASMQKDQGNAIEYVSGSLEDSYIGQRTVDILEGTRPAFDKRDDKYRVAGLERMR